MTTDHLFRIASHSTTVTATLVLQLVEDGALRLDDNVAALLAGVVADSGRRAHGAGVAVAFGRPVPGQL
ncbi:MAG: serine hydrolase [Nakamurella sp.]